MTTIEGLNPDFEDMLAALSEEGAEFVIVGAYAVSFHGIPRATGDIDIFVHPAQDNAERVLRALVRFGAPVDAAGLTCVDLAAAGTVYQIGIPPRRIDIVTEISGVDFQGAWDSRIEARLGDHTIHFIGRAALLRNKRAAGRSKDLADLKLLSNSDAAADEAREGG